MKKQWKGLFAVGLFALWVGGMSGCETGDTGSSSSDDSGDDNDSIDTSGAVSGLKEAICARIIACNSDISQQSCFSGFLGTNQLADNFGVPEEENSLTMSEVSDGDYDVNQDAYDQCLSDLGALTCSEIAAGTDDSGQTIYDQIENLIPEDDNSCSGVFESLSSCGTISCDDNATCEAYAISSGGGDTGSCINGCCTVEGSSSGG